MVSPILLVAIFLMAFAFSFYLSEADEQVAEGISVHGMLQKFWNEQSEAKLLMRGVVLQEISTNTSVNNLGLMEQAIEQELAEFNASVSILSGVDDMTRVKVDVNHNMSDKGIFVNFTGFVDDFNHPLFLFNATATAYNPAIPNVCVHVDGVLCSFNEVAYEQALSTPEIIWVITRTGLVCNPAVVLDYTVKLKYADNLLTARHPFHLKDKATGSETFSVNC